MSTIVKAQKREQKENAKFKKKWVYSGSRLWI